jgi:hypothetical protein
MELAVKDHMVDEVSHDEWLREADQGGREEEHGANGHLPPMARYEGPELFQIRQKPLIPFFTCQGIPGCAIGKPSFQVLKPVMEHLPWILSFPSVHPVKNADSYTMNLNNAHHEEHKGHEGMQSQQSLCFSSRSSCLSWWKEMIIPSIWLNKAGECSNHLLGDRPIRREDSVNEYALQQME